MLSIFFSLILSLSLSSHPGMSAGFSLKLIHRDSPLSPLYQSNLTNFERFLKNAESSRARALYFQQEIDKGSSKASLNPSIRIPARLEDPIFMVEIGIGTPETKRALHFDTGSSLTWTQCSPCTKCFKQNYHLFEPNKSSSYKNMDRTHPLSSEFRCSPSGCNYQTGYLSGETTAGAVATETFTFQSKSRRPVALPNIVFGCGTSNIGFNGPLDVCGLLGMNRQPVSFARQLEGLSKGRFSYCLSTVISKKPTSYVKFGDEAKIGGWWRAKKTPFLNKNRENKVLYYVELSDLSINGRKLRLGRAAFPNGCIVDSGASLSQLGKPAFSAVRDFMVNYFKLKGITRYSSSDLPNFLCFSVPPGFASFPSMTFHFRGTDYRVPSSNLFFRIGNNLYCLTIMEQNSINILGAYHQRNVRIVYDLKENMLSFAPEDCSKDLK